MWLQCEECLKWRKVPASHYSVIPESWYCSQNPNPRYRCVFLIIAFLGLDHLRRQMLWLRYNGFVDVLVNGSRACARACVLKQEGQALNFSSSWVAQPGLFYFQKLHFTRGSRRQRGAANTQLPEKPQETVNSHYISLDLSNFVCVRICTQTTVSHFYFSCMPGCVLYVGSRAILWFPSVSFTLLFPVYVTCV